MFPIATLQPPLVRRDDQLASSREHAKGRGRGRGHGKKKAAVEVLLVEPELENSARDRDSTYNDVEEEFNKKQPERSSSANAAKEPNEGEPNQPPAKRQRKVGEDEKESKGPTFARRYCPARQLPADKWAAIKDVFELMIKPDRGFYKLQD